MKKYIFRPIPKKYRILSNSMLIFFILLFLLLRFVSIPQEWRYAIYNGVKTIGITNIMQAILLIFIVYCSHIIDAIQSSPSFFRSDRLLLDSWFSLILATIIFLIIELVPFNTQLLPINYNAIYSHLLETKLLLYFFTLIKITGIIFIITYIIGRDPKHEHSKYFSEVIITVAIIVAIIIAIEVTMQWRWGKSLAY